MYQATELTGVFADVADETNALADLVRDLDDHLLEVSADSEAPCDYGLFPSVVAASVLLRPRGLASPGHYLVALRAV